MFLLAKRTPIGFFSERELSVKQPTSSFTKKRKIEREAQL